MDNLATLPSIRTNIKAEVYQEDGREYVYLTDPDNYAGQPVSIPTEFLPLLSFLDGNYNMDKVESIIRDNNSPADTKEIMESFVNLINFLDYLGYLKSSHFEIIKEGIDKYLNSKIRTPYCSGTSYSEEYDSLVDELHIIFASVNKDAIKPGANTIIVPHIDFRIGKKAHTTYAAGYFAMKNEKPNLVVIFGTSHNGSSKRFIFSKKHFETPLGVVENATELTNRLFELLGADSEIIIDEICHRNEHSIEFQVLLSQYFFNDKPFKILPVLVNSFVGDIYKGRLPEDDENFNTFIKTFNKVIEESHYNPIYIASADMAHIGRKFDDDFDAVDRFEILRKEDKELINHILNCDANSFFSTVADINDRNKICGLAPIYTLLKIRKPQACQFLNYEIWNEEETKSAVSFASFAFYK